MKINPILKNSFRVNVLTNKKQSRQNIIFGKFESGKKDEIIKKLRLDSNEKIDTLEKDQGVILKSGSKTNPRGLVYADLINEYVTQSAGIGHYKLMEGDRFSPRLLDHLEDANVFNEFYEQLLYAKFDEEEENNPPAESSETGLSEEEQRDYWHLMDNITH